MKATNARTEMRSILTSYATELDTAAKFTNPDYSGQGIADERERLRQRATEIHTKRAGKLVETTTAEALRDAARADQEAAKLSRHSGDRTLQEGQEWTLNILPQLERGVPMIEILKSLGADGLNAVERFGPNWERGNVGKGGHEEKMHAEARAAALADSVRTLRWDLVTDPAGQRIIEQARLTATIAEVAGAFNAQVQNVRRSSALSGASTYLTTAEAPAFGGGFASALQAESAA